MLQGLKQRFEYATDPSAVKFDPLFVTATFLNPPYREILTDTQTKTAKQYLIELCKPPKSDANLQDDDCTYVPGADLEENHEITPPSKRPKLLLSRVASFRGVGSTGSTSSGAPLEISLCTYITQLITYTHNRLYT